MNQDCGVFGDFVKPDWRDAPDGANFLAQDGDGTWYWYEEKPRWIRDQWVTDGMTWLANCLPNPDAAKTLEWRP